MKVAQADTYKTVALLLAKIHPFSFAGEDRHYEAGDHVVTADVEGVRVTPFVCYDLRFPEPFRVAARETDPYSVVDELFGRTLK